MKDLRRFFRAEDFATLLFITILIVTPPEKNYDANILLPIIGAFQIIEPRLKSFSSLKGQIISVASKILLSYLLIGFSHIYQSYYYPVFLIPVVSAATTFELTGLILVLVVCCLAYFSFLLPVYNDWNSVPEGYDQLVQIAKLMSVRVSFFAIVGFVVYEQAKAKREEMKRTAEAAARLAESNKNLRDAQVSLRRSERLAALGQLTAGLAHELRNPLGTIKASAEMLSKDSMKCRPEMMSEMTGYIRSEVDRMSGLITSFLNFARPLELHPLAADLRLVVEDVLRQQAELARSRGVELVTQLNDGVGTFDFDPDLLKVALSNLIQNAVQASSSGQRVEIRSDQGNGVVLLFVADHGEGIPPQNLESIFNPFFTTKSEGVGLGLALVAKIVDEHRGRIQVFSEPSRGTTFEITLPKEQPT